MIFVTKRLDFSAGHRLFNPELSDDENLLLFDKCNNPNGHGHNYYIEVTIAGEIDPRTGYVFDLKKMKQIINDELISKVDHKNLNVDVDFLFGKNPTVENLVCSFWDVLNDKFLPAKLFKIKLFETESSFVEYFGDNCE